MISPEQQGAEPNTEAVFAKVGECLYRHQSSGVYYGLVKRSGKQFRRSLKTTDRALAKTRLSDFREKVGRLGGKSAHKVTFTELADRWLALAKARLKDSSARRVDLCVKELKKTFGAIGVRNITRADCDEWAMKREPQISASTFNKEREALQQILSFGCRDGVLLDNPAAHIERRKQPKASIIIPTREQFLTITKGIRQLDVRAHASADLVELLAFSGMRLAEATAMKWRDIDWQRGTFAVTGGETGTKNHEARIVPLFPNLRTHLEQLKVEKSPKQEDYVIPIDNAKIALKTACKAAELPQFTHHAFRHFFVTNAIELGVDFKVIAEWVGHKDGGVLVA
ncbi:MAG TPA: site-specific integrase, partial [Candidatus Saccharimonadales bacterium]|nr:site-specific integrase [Candidatus Saccharimonadales bacterium]